MTLLQDAPAPAPSLRRDARAAARRRFSLTTSVVAVMLLAGVGTVTYPTAANWFSDRAHATEVSGYVDEVKDTSASQLQKILGDALQYNQDLQSGPLRDPFTLKEDGSAEDVKDGLGDYMAQLDFGTDKPMARIRIPEIGADLPIYHGTSDAVLENGVGHLYGTSLPVGGDDTHAVLSGHSGIPGSDLFTHVNKLKVGDRFYIDVAGETLTYQVDKVLTVAPDDADNLRQVQGHDYITLLTCTPIGVNSHRLLVRGERVDAQSASGDSASIAPNATDPGFPWWALWSGTTLIWCVVLAWPRRRSTTPRPNG